MHVPWGWIKQRPHFLAETLAEEYEVTVCFSKSYNSHSLIGNWTESKINLKELYVLPFSRFMMVAKINMWLINKQLPDQLTSYDIVWITHPYMYRAVINDLSDDTYVVYDCMDDALEIPFILSHPSVRHRIASEEKQLLTRSNAIFVTSNYLKNKLLQRYEIDKNIHVINNAINIYKNDVDNDLLKLPPILERMFSSTETKKLVYIGTISEWFDFDLILRSVEQFANITYILIGPADVTIPQHERIIYHPPIEHKSIYKIMALADALLMPFRINELTLAVNPVKIYEYIFSAKPSIVRKYQETEKFSDYVHLYNSKEEYLQLIEKVAAGKLTIKRDREDYSAYGRQNTWPARVIEIRNVLNQ
jgi:hypothetical protein